MVWQEYGESLETKEGLVNLEEALSGKKLVGLYFCASWNDDSELISPLLNKFYKEMKYQHSDFELIFVSLDNKFSPFLLNYNKMLFTAIPFKNQSTIQYLKSKYQVDDDDVELIFLQETAEVITYDGLSILFDDLKEFAKPGFINKIWEQLTEC